MARERGEGGGEMVLPLAADDVDDEEDVVDDGIVGNQGRLDSKARMTMMTDQASLYDCRVEGKDVVCVSSNKGEGLMCVYIDR